MTTLSIHTMGTKEQLFALLTDYERYVEWTPDVVEATLLAREGDIVVAEFFSPELMDETYQLECVHTQPKSIDYWQKGLYEDTGRSKLGLHGSWQLTDAPDGHGTIVTGTMRLKRDRWHQMAYRKRVEIILQRRLEVLQQMLLPDAVRDEQNLDERENQFVRALALDAAARTGKEFAVWFHRPHARPHKVE